MEMGNTNHTLHKRREENDELLKQKFLFVPNNFSNLIKNKFLISHQT
jgi:hypothetical protein